MKRWLLILSALFSVGCSIPHRINLAAGTEPTHWHFGASYEIRAFATNRKPTNGFANLVRDDQSLISDRAPKSGLRLTGEHARQLRRILYTTGRSDGAAKCGFQPRHAFLFYAANGTVLSSIDICFLCSEYRSAHPCFPVDLDYQQLNLFVKGLGPPIGEEAGG